MRIRLSTWKSDIVSGYIAEWTASQGQSWDTGRLKMSSTTHWPELLHSVYLTPSLNLNPSTLNMYLRLLIYLFFFFPLIHIEYILFLYFLLLINSLLLFYISFVFNWHVQWIKSWAQLLGPARTLAFILKAAVAECPLELTL